MSKNQFEGQLSASQSKFPFFCGRRYLRKLSKFIIRARAVTPGLWSRGLYWLLIVTCHSVSPPPLQKRAKSCEHQRHWRWRPFTLIPRVAHSHTDSLKENVSWIHKLIGSTTNPSSAWLLIQLLCSKNMKWAGQETGMQPWRTTHSGIYTSKGENLINLVISFYMNFVRVWVQLVFRWMQIYLIIFKNKALALLSLMAFDTLIPSTE